MTFISSAMRGNLRTAARRCRRDRDQSEAPQHRREGGHGGGRSSRLFRGRRLSSRASALEGVNASLSLAMSNVATADKAMATMMKNLGMQLSLMKEALAVDPAPLPRRSTRPGWFLIRAERPPASSRRPLPTGSGSRRATRSASPSIPRTRDPNRLFRGGRHARHPQRDRAGDGRAAAAGPSISSTASPTSRPGCGRRWGQRQHRPVRDVRRRSQPQAYGRHGRPRDPADHGCRAPPPA